MQDQTNNSSVKNYDTSTLTDEELAKKAQEELNMEEDMEEVSSIFKWFELVNMDMFKDCIMFETMETIAFHLCKNPRAELVTMQVIVRHFSLRILKYTHIHRLK